MPVQRTSWHCLQMKFMLDSDMIRVFSPILVHRDKTDEGTLLLHAGALPLGR